MLSALNTGHDGGCATLHANAVADVPARLDALGALAGLSGAAVAAQAGSALDLVLHLQRDGGSRGLIQIGVVTRGSDGLAVQLAVGRADPHSTALHEGPGAETLERLITGPRR